MAKILRQSVSPKPGKRESTKFTAPRMPARAMASQWMEEMCIRDSGERRNEHAERILGTAAALLLGLSVVLLVLGYLYMEPLLWMFGASESTIGYATDYFSIYLVGTPFVLLTLGLNPFVTSQGFARTGMMTILIGAVANILLDPLFILSLIHI